ncbi:MAG: LysM peptidoglycan-binding domain-containing protein, partial [Ideonella sp.]|nr:LysM peptidoglycan-binding domain-containing protein [Ideonella sp.]
MNWPESVLRTSVGICVLAVAAAAAAAPEARPPVSQVKPRAAEARPAAREWRYRVAPGDTLIMLAARYLDDPDNWQSLQRHNQVGDPRRLVPGSTIRIPYDWLRREASVAEVVF